MAPRLFFLSFTFSSAMRYTVIVPDKIIWCFIGLFTVLLVFSHPLALALAVVLILYLLPLAVGVLGLACAGKLLQCWLNDTR